MARKSHEYNLLRDSCLDTLPDVRQGWGPFTSRACSCSDGYFNHPNMERPADTRLADCIWSRFSALFKKSQGRIFALLRGETPAILLLSEPACLGMRRSNWLSQLRWQQSRSRVINASGVGLRGTAAARKSHGNAFGSGAYHAIVRVPEAEQQARHAVTVCPRQSTAITTRNLERFVAVTAKRSRWVLPAVFHS